MFDSLSGAILRLSLDRARAKTYLVWPGDRYKRDNQCHLLDGLHVPATHAGRFSCNATWPRIYFQYLFAQTPVVYSLQPSTPQPDQDEDQQACMYRVLALLLLSTFGERHIFVSFRGRSAF